LCARYGIDRSVRVKHGALIDAQLLAQVYVELTGGRQIGLSLASATLSTTVEFGLQPGSVPASVAARPPRPHGPSAEELERHAAFLRTIIDPLWNRLDPARLTQGRDGA